MDWLVVAAISEVLAAVATAGAVAWAGFEFHRTRLADLDARVAEIEAVTIGISEFTKPHRSAAHDGAGVFGYTFTLQNPGRLPITHVSVLMRFPGPVRRIYADAAEHLEDAKDVHEMYAPSVSARGTHAWRRSLLVPVECWAQMRQTTADILFTTADAGPVVTRWPSPAVQPSITLRRRLRQETRR